MTQTPPPPPGPDPRAVPPAPGFAAPQGFSAPPVPAGAHPALAELPPGVRYTDPWKRLGCALLEVVLVWCTLYLGWLVWACLTVGSGQTPAKRLLKIRVISAADKRPVGFANMFFLRYLVGGLVASLTFCLTLGVLLFMPFWDKRNQTIFEKVSGTLVVDDPGNVWQR